MNICPKYDIFVLFPQFPKIFNTFPQVQWKFSLFTYFSPFCAFSSQIIIFFSQPAYNSNFCPPRPLGGGVNEKYTPPNSTTNVIIYLSSFSGSFIPERTDLDFSYQNRTDPDHYYQNWTDPDPYYQNWTSPDHQYQN